MMPRPAARHAFDLRNDLTEIEKLSQELEDFAALGNLPSGTLFAINLALEEVITNVIAHGYQDDSPHVINVQLRVEDDAVMARVEDDGFAFNPLTAAAPDVAAPLDDRDVGGLGVLLVRKLTDDVSYERVSGKNVLTFRKQIEPRESSE